MEDELNDGRGVDEANLLDALATFPIKSLNMNLDNWEKMLSIESFKSIVMNFLNNPQLERIYFLNVDGIILPCEKLTQHTSKSKVILCQRITPQVITLNNYKEIVKFCDFPANTMNYLDIHTDHIQIPLLTHPQFAAHHPVVVQKELQSNLQELKNLIDVTGGALRGENVLAIPLNVDLSREADFWVRHHQGDRDFLTQLERMACKWHHIVQEHVSVTPNSIFEGRGVPTLVHEFDFWAKRRETFLDLSLQFNSPAMRNIRVALEVGKSVYLDKFQVTQKAVDDALNEADDISLYLTPLKPLVDFSGINLDDIQKKIPAIFHTIFLIWRHSKYYNTDFHMARLCLLLDNALLHHIKQLLNSDTMFAGEIETSCQHVHDTMAFLTNYREASMAFKSRLMKVSNNAVRFTLESHTHKAIYERLADLEDILKTMMDYQKLESVEFGGIRGKEHTRSMKKILQDFQGLCQTLSDLPFNPLDIDGDPRDFNSVKELFKQQSEDMDEKITTLLSRTISNCSNISQIINTLTAMGSFIGRGILNKNYREHFPTICALFQREIDAIDDIIDGNEKVKGDGEFLLNAKASSHSDMLVWINQLKSLLKKPFDELTLVVDTDGIFTSVDGMRLMEKFENVSAKLVALEEATLSKWKDEAIVTMKVGYAEPLIVLNTLGIPSANINYNLSTIMRDARIIQQLKYDIPEEIACEFQERFTSSWMVKNKLLSFCEKYRFVRTEMNEYELAVIGDELHAIDNDIAMLIEKDSWGNFDMVRIEGIEGRINNLHERMIRVKENTMKIIKHLNEMKQSPLYHRKDRTINGLIVFNERHKILPRWFWKCMKLNKLIKTVLTENFAHLTDTQHNEDEKSKEILVNPKRRDFHSGFNQKFINRFAHQRLKYYWSEIQRIGSENAAFVKYKNSIDNMLLGEFGEILRVSLNHIEDELRNASSEKRPPIIEINLLAWEESIIFEPSMEINSQSGLYWKFKGVIHDIVSLLKLIVRINDKSNQEMIHTGEIPTFWSLYPTISEIEKVKKFISGLISDVKKCVSEHYEEYMKYEKFLIGDKAHHIDAYVNDGENLPFWQTPQSSTSSEVEFDGSQPSNTYRSQFDRLNHVYDAITLECETKMVCKGWLIVNSSKLTHELLQHIKKWTKMLKIKLQEHVDERLRGLKVFFDTALRELSEEIDLKDFEKLKRVLQTQKKIAKERAKEDDGVLFKPLVDIVNLLKSMNIQIEENILEMLENLPRDWMALKMKNVERKEDIINVQDYQMDMTGRQGELFGLRLKLLKEEFEKSQIFKYPCENVYDRLDGWFGRLTERRREHDEMVNLFKDFGMNFDQRDEMVEIERRLRQLKHLWDAVVMIEGSLVGWQMTLWSVINLEEVDQECRVFLKYLRTLDKSTHHLEPFMHCDETLRSLTASLRTLINLQEPSMKGRHWKELRDATGEDINVVPTMTLKVMLDHQLQRFDELVKEIVDKSVQEQSIDTSLGLVKDFWEKHSLEYEENKKLNVKLPKWSEEVFEVLDDHLMQLNNIGHSRFLGAMAKEASKWKENLESMSKILNVWFEVQRKWLYMESIFMWSHDIKVKVPDETQRFVSLDGQLKRLAEQLRKCQLTIKIISLNNLLAQLQAIDDELMAIEKVLNGYLEEKRMDFPRFYFISSLDLLDILTCGTKPREVFRHLTKLFDSIKSLQMGDGQSLEALGMFSKEDEYVTFSKSFKCQGTVEKWLNNLIDEMRQTLRHVLGQAVSAYTDKPRYEWILDWPAQPALCGSQIWWATEVERAFRWLEVGNENAMKNYHKRQKEQLSELINMLIGELTVAERQKIMTICTIDVHSRDVVAKLIGDRIDNVMAFQWQSQLRHRWDEDANDCFANICDAEFPYDHEYLGNTPRLVVTPLTDKCYITLTQSLHLFMGGAPAGPAGTGKTETTKDLGRALGMMVYVFNCSEQMDYKSCGNIYKGLAQTGAFGCFDEFNRISVEVLSVVAIQVKTILEALKAHRTTFNFLGETIKLVPTVGIFITMNPGYAGRTELPENLKSLFRPCSMIVPDIELICEIFLVAEGFQTARTLARKFISLYSMCRELLSKQDHYDWGLRAVKSVLTVAGSLKRADPGRSEDEVLMRALRDFNTPKIPVDDIPVFLGLIGDLFLNLEVPRRSNVELVELVKEAAVDLHFQPVKNFVQKVTELEEILHIRHSVFIIGAAGVGKSCVWKTLLRTYEKQGRKPVYNDLNPKAVTNDQLFGVVHGVTREWQDGLLSIIMRDQAYAPGEAPKWIVFDGDIDPMWIESLNTVMDDNKVLTLANNERIPLTPSMRLLFEIGHLRAATPATVSRAGILYINSQDVGYQPLIVSWIERRESDGEKIILNLLFNKYVPVILEAIHKRFTTIIPLVDVALVRTTCSLLDSLLTADNVPANSPNEWYETYFVFAAIWGFGGALYRDQQHDWRLEFHRWWVRTFRTIKFPNRDATVFDYHIDPDTKKFTLWSSLKDDFKFYPEIPLQMTFVDTEDSVRLQYLLELLIRAEHPAMIVGGGGCGKTMLVQRRLASLPSESTSANIPVNLYTTSRGFQESLEMHLEKSTARTLTPKSGRKLIYFVDDINLPQVDLYGSVAPHTLLRQFFDYHHWYECDKYVLKSIHNCSFVATMNPNVGSFTINPRLQRHFATIAMNFPTNPQLQFIYSSILGQHLGNKSYKFTEGVQDICSNIVKSVVDLHVEVCQVFLPTSTKFHYNFNLHDITNVFQGLIFSRHASCPTKEDFFKLLIHELYRVYADRLISHEDLNTFDTLIATVTDRAKDYLDEVVQLPTPLIYFHYANGLSDAEYALVNSWEHLNALLEEAQVNYREIVGPSNLVLFEDAMAHVCRIIRILESARGHVMLVGVGGSGKRSLTKLSAFISSLAVEQIQLSSAYGVVEFKGDLAELYKRAGVRAIKCCLMMSDAQIATEEFVMIINDVLTTGECVNLLPPEDVDEIVLQVRTAAKQQGLPDDRTNCWRFFIDRVRNNLKMILSCSPVGNTLRQRARKFPGIFSNCRINWFHDWPREALVSVAEKFLNTFELMPREYVQPVSNFLADVNNSVNDVSKIYRETEKRFNYTTPKIFLDTIDLFRKLFVERNERITQWINRLDQGLLKLDATTNQVDTLKETLADQEITMSVKKDEADWVLEVLQKENAVVSFDRSNVAEEERNVRMIEVDITERARQCEAEVKLAEPAIVQAEEALNTLDKRNLTELKSFGTPPPGVEFVTEAVLVLFAHGKIPKDRSWKACRVMMGKADTFLSNLKTFDKENISEETIAAILPYLKKKDFMPERMRAKSSAAAGLCAWVRNIYKFHQVYKEVKPKLKALDSARQQLAIEQAKLAELNGKLSVLQEKLSGLENKLQVALDEQQVCQDEVDRTANALDLANRLILGLSSERVRWKRFIVKHREQMNTTLGDTLIAACFISYLGYFTHSYREKIIRDYWTPALSTLEPQIATGEDLVDLNPFLIMCNDAMAAEWSNEGLPSDKISRDNAMILLNSVRWPLMIDPQLQGIKWIRGRFQDVAVTRLDAEDCLSVVEAVVRVGGVLVIENVGETLNPMLANLFGRVLTRGGQTLMLGDHEIDYNPTFRLILQTKLSNPHYQPEVQAQLTLINFTVTREGLEDQLLVDVVKLERPELEEQQRELSVQRNVFKIQLKDLEDKLLERLSGETGNILENSSLVENVEANKKLAEEIESRSREARDTAEKVTAIRELYRDVARRAAIIYFVLMDLHRVNPIYQYSMELFRRVFVRAIQDTPRVETVHERVHSLMENITYQVYDFISRGMFKKDKWLLLIQISCQLYIHSMEYNPSELAFLLRYPTKATVKSPVPFLTDDNWAGVTALAEMDNFRDLDRDIERSSKRWMIIVKSEMPENEKFPGDWRNKNSIQKLCILRVLRPDRMVYACYKSAIDRLGSRFHNIPPPEMSKIFQESSSKIPIFFILSPGVDPIGEVERMGHQLKFTTELGNCHIISLGQGQEMTAERVIATGATRGHWVILENIHLVAKWLPKLEKCIEAATRESHESFRLFMSAEPAESADYHILPQGILESTIKVTNEPPSGIRANLHGALNQFTQATLELSPKEVEFKAILFAMCYFHAIVGERRKFGPAGWNRLYPFNYGDLTFSSSVLLNYLEDDITGVPWDDLRYMFGEIIYGGHITDDWDKRLCYTYLQEYLKPSLIEHELEFCPGFDAPPNLEYTQYHEYIDEKLPDESPYIYGLHPNVEIVVETSKAENMFAMFMQLQPQGVSSSASEGVSRRDVVRDIVDDFLDRCYSGFVMEELSTRAKNLTPYTIVALQECERMNVLWREIKRSLLELKMGLSGELTMSNDMDELEDALFTGRIPAQWVKIAYPSLLGVHKWLSDLLYRVQELEIWTSNFSLPSVVWLGGFFNPQSLLTAVMQQTARRHGYALDRMSLNCDVTGKMKGEIQMAPKEGINIHGLHMEGAKWSVELGKITEAKFMELTSELPVVQLRAVISEKQDKRGAYECPLYRNRSRGSTYVWTFNLKSNENAAKWILGGVCLLLEP